MLIVQAFISVTDNCLECSLTCQTVINLPSIYHAKMSTLALAFQFTANSSEIVLQTGVSLEAALIVWSPLNW